MRLKLTLFLALLNVALFSYIFYLETEGKGAEAEEGGRLILPAGMINRAEEVSLAGESVQDPWTLRRQTGRWLVAEPVEWPANPYAVRRLLDLLSFLQWETRFPVASLGNAGKKLEDYGLGAGAPELHITSERDAVRLRVGLPTEIGNRVYVLSPDQSEVFVVERGLLEGIGMDVESLVERSVVEIPTFEVESLNLRVGRNNAVRVQLARENGSWVFNAPIRVAADSGKVDTALDALHNLAIDDFAELAPGPAGLANPTLRININGNNRQQTLLLGDLVDPDAFPVLRYAKLEARPAVITVPAAPFEIWFKAQESLRERRFMDFAPEDASALEIQFDDHSTTLQKLESGSWQLVQAQDGNLTTQPADDDLVQELLHSLSTLDAARFVSDAPSSANLDLWGFNDPQRIITVRLNNGANRSLVLGNFVTDDRQNRVYAKRMGGASVYLTNASILSQFPLSGLHYRERVAGSLPSGAVISKIRIRDLAGEHDILEMQRGVHDNWESALAEHDSTEAAAVKALLQAFRRFPVNRFVADEFTDPLQLDRQRTLPWAFVVEADVQLPGGENKPPDIRRYYLSERLGGTTQYAGSQALDLTFLLPQDLIDALHPVLSNRPRPDEETHADPPEAAPAQSATMPSDAPAPSQNN